MESFPASDAPASLSEIEPDDVSARKVAVIIGSLRRGAYSRMAANALIAMAPQGLHLEIVEILDLTLFNQDLEDDPPAAWTVFRDRVREFDAVIFMAPEYNRSMPAPLKNAVDIGSRPPGQNLWDGVPAGVVSTSPGALGGISSNNHLRQTLTNVNMFVLPQPNVSIGRVDTLFDENGNLTNEGTKKYLASFLDSFAKWIEKFV
ncbi:MAG: NAD(P)H-dependent oxidoreductase [Armatimonadetes bacterium]|nr:NAD(P)H-dependent oxidoreductase [Armatimonadota bacterium]